MDRSNLLERFFDLLNAHGVRFCLIGGQALNAYVEPVVSLDLDVVIAPDRSAGIDALLADHFVVERFPHSVNVSEPQSDVRIQIQLDPRYAAYVDRAATKDVLGFLVPVAAIEDLLQGKVWAVQDPERRRSKRQKDLADIARIIEAYPHLRQLVPGDVLARLM